MDKSKLLEDKFMTPAKFSQEVEKIAVHNSDMNYIDAVLHFCEVNEIEVESVPKLLSKPLKEKIKYGHFESCEFGRSNCNYANSYTKYCNAFGKENVLPIIMEEFWEPEREKEQRERLSDFIGYQIESIHPNFFWPIDNQVDDTYLTDQSDSIHDPLTPEVIEYAKKYMKHF